MARKKDARDGFSERLRKLRIQKELSQMDLAKMVGIHYNQIGRYEQGTSQPGADKINKLADALAVSADYLLEGEMKNAARADFEDQDLLMMFQAVQKLPDSDKFVAKCLLSCLLNQNKMQDMVDSAKAAS